jgi:hypothetical protein
MNAYSKYAQFHGRHHKKVNALNFHVPKTLVLLGEAIAVEYRCDKLNGGGDGKKAVYRHEFETPAIVCMDEKARRQLYIIGPSITVDDEGIKN